MIVILKPHAEPDKVQSLLDGFAAKGLSHHISTGQSTTIVGIIGIPPGWISTACSQTTRSRTSNGSPSLTRRPTGNSIRRTPSSASSARLGKP